MIISAIRPSSWLKNLAILPAWYFYHGTMSLELGLVFVSATFFSIGNYLFNEWSDRYQDQSHPQKRNRYFVLNAKKNPWPYVLMSWLMACSIGAYVNWRCLLVILGLMGASILYNSTWTRIKNVAYWDFLVEALNAPLRGLLGWIVAGANDSHRLYQVLLAYYMISLSIMLLKRSAEIKLFTSPILLKQYRPSLLYYHPTTLNVLSLISLICGIYFSCWAIIF